MASIVAVSPRPSDEASFFPVVIASFIVHLLVFAGIPILTTLFYHSQKYERPRTFQLVSPSLIKTPIASMPKAKAAAAPKKVSTTPVPKKQHSKPQNTAVKEENTSELNELLDAVSPTRVSDIAPAEDFKYNWYLQSLVSKVEEQWKPPMGLTDKPDAAVVVSFTVSQSGAVSNIDVVTGSGVPTLDRLAQRAVQLAAPFGKLPLGFSQNKLDISYTLHYVK
jgi:TonB family protein